MPFLSGHLKVYCNLSAPRKYSSLSEHPIGSAKVTVTAEHPSARFNLGKRPLMHHIPSPHRGSAKFGPVTSSRWRSQVVPSFMPAGTWLKVFSVWKRRKKSHQNNLWVPRDLSKAQAGFLVSCFCWCCYFTAREVPGLISCVWEAEPVMLHLSVLHQAKPIPEVVHCTSTSTDVTSSILLTLISLWKM